MVPRLLRLVNFDEDFLSLIIFVHGSSHQHNFFPVKLAFNHHALLPSLTFVDWNTVLVVYFLGNDEEAEAVEIIVKTIDSNLKL